jgi:N-hydroxyarylamine O-acetyltransferase
VRVESYLARVGYDGPLTPSVGTLRALHRAHLLSISYENLDIHLGRPMELDPARIYAKLVERKRGGWCFEMNGLFAWVLREVGFEVTMVSATVGGARHGQGRPGNHLVLVVSLDRPWLVDVGFGDGFLEPLPLEPGSYTDHGFEFRLERDDSYWVFHNHRFGAAPSYDFQLVPRELLDFAARSHELATSPDSSFVQKTVCQRFTLNGIATLRGAVFREVTPAGATERVVTHLEEYRSLLAEGFDLEVDGLEPLWRRVQESHRAWVASRAAARSSSG